MPDHLSLDQLDISEYHGVKITQLGEDGDGEAAFTHDRRRAVAACLAMYRSGAGERVRAISVAEPIWWRVVGNCGCGDACTCPRDEDGYTEHNACQRLGLPPCHTEQFTWMGLVCGKGDLGALPVTRMEAELW
jgi:hypothetical protein